MPPSAVLFGSGAEAFYACSAMRDPSECSQWRRADLTPEAVSETRRAERAESRARAVELFLNAEVAAARAGPAASRHFCATCGRWVTRSARKRHGGHDVRPRVADEALARPSRLLAQLGANKREAQYHFTQQTLNTVLSMVRGQGFTRVLCVGAPTVHEALQAGEGAIESLMLDIDTRLGQFHDVNDGSWCYYNMFNHHFFLDEGRAKFDAFLRRSRGERLLLVMDPPFGGRSELLGHNIRRIEADWRRAASEAASELAVMWIFPYFMEAKVLQASPGLRMCHYAVNYENHAAFSSRGSKHGSPVRIFTNVPLGGLRLPAEEGYRRCGECGLDVAAANRHCAPCGACTSKSGAPYRHCDLCSRCVKETWRHCPDCGRCALPEHPCQLFRAKNEEMREKSERKTEDEKEKRKKKGEKRKEKKRRRKAEKEL